MTALLIERQAGVLTATLNRPEAHNAIDPAMVAGLTAAMDAAEGDPSIRVLCLRANGRSFCGGVDLRQAREAGRGDADEGEADAARLTGMMLRLSRLSRPTMALVMGSAYGAGVGLLAACDIALAVPEARFALTQVRHGLLPGFVAPFLAHAIGTRRARLPLMTGEKFSAAEAQALGLVQEVVSAEAMGARAAAIVASLARGGPESLTGTKRLLDAYGPPPLSEAQMRDLALAVAAHRRGAEAQEGMAAFREKRAPAWCAGEEQS